MTESLTLDAAMTPTLQASDGAPLPIDRLALGLGDAATDAAARYEVQRLLGVGGMGEVRLCNDLRIGREVAYKIAIPTEGRATVSPRFVREALLQARLEHPSFVPVYDVGTTESGEVFFTMRRIRGDTLHDVIAHASAGQGERFTRQRLLASFVQLCLAVDYAHSRGVVHRDLKPANVMLGGFGEVYVLDWGIARILGEFEALTEAGPRASEPDARTTGPGTAEGAVLGTLGYMPPEQLRGEHASIDARADVYALGAILFELLALSPLHAGTNAGALATSTLAGEHRSPRERAPERDIAPELDAICVRATEARREDRFVSARELAEAIERFLDGDRDAVLRRNQARELSVRAATELSRSDEAHARAGAGRLAARALAFDPANVEAQRTLFSVVTEAPSQVPLDATRDAIETQRGASRALTRIFGTGLFVVNIGFACLLLAAGVRDQLGFALMLLCGFAAAALIGWSARAERGASAVQTLGFALLCVTNGLLTRWLSPWIIVPITMFINTMSLTFFYGSRIERAARVAMAALVLVIPVALEETGLVAPSYAFTPDRVVIFAQLTSFPVWLPWVLTFASAGMISAVLVLTTLLDRMRALETRFHIQAWMLKQILASEP